MLPDTVLLADRYRLGEVLGTGGVAEVRRARDTLLARDVAIKLFRPGDDLSDARRIEAEICALAGLSHPGLVKVYDADPGGETPYVVLELIEGKTLRDRLAKGPMSVQEVRRVGSALADALTHVHSRGFIHRDVKPSNILFDDDGLPRLADFGLVRSLDDAGVTRTGQVVGTAAYLSPEQVRGEELTASVDVYALGLVLLECLTGRREYQGAEVEAAVARLHRPPVIPDDLPFDLVRLLSTMTSLSVARRPSAAECAEALRTPVADPPTAVVPRPRSRGLLAAASAVVLISVIGTGISAWNSVTATGADQPETTAPASTQTAEQTAGFAPTPVAVQPLPPADAPPAVQAVDNRTVVEPENDKGKPAEPADKGKAAGPGAAQDKAKPGAEKPGPGGHKGKG